MPLVLGLGLPGVVRAHDGTLDDAHRTFAIDSRGKPVPPPYLRGDVGFGLARAPILGVTTVLHARIGGGGDHWHAAFGTSHWGQHAVAWTGEPWASRVSLWTFDLRGCALASRRRWSFPLCTGLDAGAVRFGHGDRRVRAPWVATVLGSGVQWWAHRLVGFGLQVEALVIVRPELEGGASMRPDPRRMLGVRASLEVAFRAIP